MTDATGPTGIERSTESSAAHSTGPGTVFISHASQDAGIAKKLCAAIEASGVPCWIAPRDVQPGESYAAAIVNAINNSKMLVLVLSRHAIDSPHVLREIERASSKRRPVLSIRVDSAGLPPDLEYFLSATQWLDASGGPIDGILPALVASVRSRDIGNAGHDAPLTRGPAEESLQAPVSPASRGRSAYRRGIGALALGIAVAAMVVGYRLIGEAWLPKRSVAQQPLAEAAPAIPDKSVAVLPFVNLSDDKNNEYFSDGLSEDLIGLLTKVPDLKVPARTSSFYFKGQQTTIAEIAKALGVSHVLEGSVRKSGNTLRITAQLVRADNGYSLWSETYDRKLDDIFKVQDEISGAVVKALKVALLENKIPKAKPEANQEAYALFLQSRSLHYRGTHADVDKAIDYAQRAVQSDPGFAPAWAAIADSLVYEYVSFGGSHNDVRARAFAAAKTSLSLDPTLSDGHLALGRVLGELDWDWAAADVELRNALALDPNNVLALEVSAGYAMCQGRLDEALRLAQQGKTLDAVSTDAISTVGDVYFASGRIADAEAAYRKATELNATHVGMHLSLGLAQLARGESAAALAAISQETDEGSRQYGLALVSDALGRRDDADRALATLETRFGDSNAGNVASIYACRKQPDQAFAWLDRAFRQHDGWLPSLRTDPCVKNLRFDPRLKTLLGKLNLSS